MVYFSGLMSGCQEAEVDTTMIPKCEADLKNCIWKQTDLTICISQLFARKMRKNEIEKSGNKLNKNGKNNAL